MTLDIGDTAPDFSKPCDGGQSLSLGHFKGKKNVVLYFYPKDDTPGCTVEAQEFRDHCEDFKSADTIILGVSRDDVKSHDKFKAKHCLPFALVSDDDGSLCEDYGVWVEKNMYGKKYMGINRATFLIDKQGHVAGLWPKVKPQGHAAEVLEAARALK